MDYDRAAATSLRLLTAFGRDVTLRTFTAGTYSTATSSVSTPTSVGETRKAVLLDFDRLNSGQKMRDGTFIKTGDKRCLMDPAGTVPALESQVVAGATTYSIVDIKDLSPAGTPVLYDMVLRK